MFRALPLLFKVQNIVDRLKNKQDMNKEYFWVRLKISNKTKPYKMKTHQKWSKNISKNFGKRRVRSPNVKAVCTSTVNERKKKTKLYASPVSRMSNTTIERVARFGEVRVVHVAHTATTYDELSREITCRWLLSPSYFYAGINGSIGKLL